MNLSSEDQLRLNVLLANADAIRIDEGAMTVYGLSDRGEAKVQLNPTGRDEAYIKAVKEMLSGAVLGSPGGYPVFLKRWTRMGQQPDQHLGDLLKLGEPEAVMAVVCAPGLNDTLARLAWWCQPSFDNARRMLEREAVAHSEMGKQLAEFIIEFLPFETDSIAIIQGIRLLLRPGLIDDEARLKIWKAGLRKSAYRVGFLLADPEALPETPPGRELSEDIGQRLNTLAGAGNQLALFLKNLLDTQGHGVMEACESVIKRPVDQDVVSSLMIAMHQFFGKADNYPNPVREMDEAIQLAQNICEAGHSPTNPEVQTLLEQVPELRDELRALLVLTRVGEASVFEVFGRTDAIGTVMKRRLEPVTDPILEQFAILRGSLK